MPVRATKRGAERTALDADADVLICGASFAGLAVARELAGAGARVMVVDRYEIGERQTSACAAPTEWLRNLGLEGSIRQTFGHLLVHPGRGRPIRYRLPWTFSTFDYRTLCAELWEQCDAEFDTAKVESIERGSEAQPSAPTASRSVPRGPDAPASLRSRSRHQTAGLDARRGTPHAVQTDRGELRAPLVVDALGWRRVLGDDLFVQPPDARLSRGLEVHPDGHGTDMELWIDPRYVGPGYAWRFPADGELRIGVGAFDPRIHVRDPTVRLAGDIGAPAVRYQGNWIPHQLRPATAGGIFFAGDSAGHCLPLTAEGIRTALYFGLACGRELRAVIEGRATREQALERYGAFSAGHARPFRWLLAMQHSVGAINRGPVIGWIMRAIDRQWWIDAFFNRYLAVAPPAFALRTPRPAVAAPA